MNETSAICRQVTSGVGGEVVALVVVEVVVGGKWPRRIPTQAAGSAASTPVSHAGKSLSISSFLFDSISCLFGWFRWKTLYCH